MSYSSNNRRFDDRGWGEPDPIAVGQTGGGWGAPPTTGDGGWGGPPTTGNDGWGDGLPSTSPGSGRGPLDRRDSRQQSHHYESQGNYRDGYDDGPDYDMYATGPRSSRAPPQHQYNRGPPPPSRENSFRRTSGRDMDDRDYQNGPSSSRQGYGGQAYRNDRPRAMQRSAYENYGPPPRGGYRDTSDQYYNDEDCFAAENYQSDEYEQEERSLPYQLRQKGASKAKPEPKPVVGRGPTSVSTKVLRKIPGTKDSYEDLSRNGIEYAYYFLRLINYELEEMENTYFENLTRKETEELINAGVVLFGMRGDYAPQYFEYNQFVFSLGDDMDLPYCSFGRGDIVFLSRSNPLMGKPYEMMVLSKTPKTITLIFNGDIHDIREGVWRIDPAISVKIHERMEGALIALARTGFTDEGEVESRYEQWGKERKREEERINTEKETPQDVLSTAITNCSGTFCGSSLSDVILSIAPKYRAEPPAVTLEKCPGLLDWANSDADESCAPINSLQHWRCNSPSETIPSIDTYRHEPKLNPAQLQAVKSVIKHRFSLIHGPPGTGKTTTIAMLVQILLCASEELKILLCAKTHVAVDNILDSLRKHNVDALRLGVVARVREDLVDHTLDSKVDRHPEKSKLDKLRQKADRERRKKGREARRRRYGYGFDDDDGELDPDATSTEQEIASLLKKMIKDEIECARVICTTCVGAGTDRLRNVQFDVVIIDEGSQCTEPESIIPIVRGAKHAAIVGDHRQLQPVIASLYAKSEGLSMSMFERMMTLGVPSVMLDTQYRMHPCIGEISSQTFYGGRVKHGIRARDRLPPFLSKLKRDFRAKQLESSPYIVIYLENSKEVRGMSGSFKNRDEANIVLHVLDDLLKSNGEKTRHFHVKPNHIGIITPYSEQRRLIHDLISKDKRFSDIELQGFALDECVYVSDNDNLLEIHTVDGFQGREKEIIIMSTVRSGSSHGLGFLEDWRRLNVASTRARRQFILVCSAETLSRDRYWKQFVDWAKTQPDAIYASANRYMPNDTGDDDYASRFF